MSRKALPKVKVQTRVKNYIRLLLSYALGAMVSQATASSSAECSLDKPPCIVLSVGRIRQCVTSFGSHRRNTNRSLKVSISSYRHLSDLVRCGNGPGETIVVEEEQSPVVGLWGRPRGVH